MDASEFCILYTTIGSAEEARVLARTLVESKSVACANIFPKGCSVYEWDGEIQEADEVMIFFKTQGVCRDKAMSKIASLHPYECPCIVSLDLNAAHGPYLEWIARVTE